MKNKPRQSKKGSKRLLAFIILLAVCVLAFFLLGFLRRKMPDPEHADEVEICRFIASRKFREMDESQRQAFMKSVSSRSFSNTLGRVDMPPRQRENFQRNMTMVEIDKAKFFFKQNAATQKQMLKQAALQRPYERNGKGAKQENGSHRRYLEGMSAEDRAVMNAFERRVENAKQ